MIPKKRGALLLVAVLLFGACSSDGSTGDDNKTEQESDSAEPTPTETGPTAEEFIAEAETVCTTTSQKTEEILADFGVPENEKENLALGKKLIAARRDRLKQLRALDVSEDLQEQWDEYLDARQNSLDLIVERLAALEDGDDERAASLLSKVDKSDKEWQSIGAEIGFMACAYRLSPKAEKEVEVLLTQFFEGDPTKTCSGFVSKAYLDYLGGQDGCAESLEQASKISITDLEGIDEVTANGTITGSTYGKRVSVEVTYEDEKYKARILYIL